MISEDSIIDIDVTNPGLDNLTKYFDGYRATLVIQSACKLGIFDLLENVPGGTTVAKLATAQGWNEHNTERLLDGLVSLHIVKKVMSDGCYVYTNDESGKLLLHDQKGSMDGVFTEFGSKLASIMTRIPVEVEKGETKNIAFPPLVTFHKSSPENVEGQGHQQQGHHGHSHGHHGHSHGHGGPMDPQQLAKRYLRMEAPMLPVVKKLVTAFDLSKHKTVVDLGGGSGVVSFELSRCYPDMKVIMFDTAPAIQAVREHFIPKDEKLNVELCEGDFFESDLPQADMFLLSKIVHDWNESQVSDLLTRIHSKTNPGGAIMLFEKCVNDDRAGPPSAFLFDLGVMTIHAGYHRSFKEYADLFVKHGFGEVCFGRTHNECMYDVVYAKKL